MDVRAKEILDFAVSKEIAAEEFYLHWAERCDDEKLEKLLRELAAEERGHIEKLSRIAPSALVGEGTAPAEYGLLEELQDPPSDRRKMTLLDALSLAIRREEKSIRLYERMRGASASEEALFEALVQEERRHKHRLGLEYRLLKSREERDPPVE